MKNYILPEQPFDEWLLNTSKLYLQSRKFYLKQKGKFIPTLLSSARSLGSADLLINKIQYSPVKSEIDWSMSDRLQKKDAKHLALIQGFITSVYHEQNHRILWNFLRSKKLFCPKKKSQVFSFLNMTESLVVTLDMALADELDSKSAEFLYQNRALYHGGSSVMRRLKKQNPQNYKEALQICCYVVFQRLEGLHIEDIPGFTRTVFSGVSDKIADEAIKRALKLEPMFVELTNPFWQNKNLKEVINKMGSPSNEGLKLPYREPLNYEPIRLIAEDWLKALDCLQ